MKFKNLLIIFLIFFISNLSAQSKKDINTIKKMCGCFEVDFNFAETFQYVKDTNYVKSKKYNAKATEYAMLIKDEKDHISIQHILVMGEYIIKHWRQDWIYENVNFYNYHKDNKWIYVKKNKKSVKGQWTQKVYQVDDSPRYEGSGSWVHIDGKSYWENITDAPLPRREYTKRNDYNLMIRGNRHEIKLDGWIHDQDNLKVIRGEKKDSIIAAEKGYNYYRKIPESNCKSAIDWWKVNQNKWNNVRGIWDSIYLKNQDIVLKKSVSNRPLFSYLFDEKLIKRSEIGSIIDNFILD